MSLLSGSSNVIHTQLYSFLYSFTLIIEVYQNSKSVSSSYAEAINFWLQ